MPAKSKAQQKFMGMVHAAKKGEKPASKEVAAAAKGMTKKAAKDFASTKHKGLPEKVKKSKTEESLLKEFEDKISEVTVTSGPNKGKQWSPKTPGPTNKNYKEIDGNIPSPPDGATAPPPGYRPPKGSLGGPKGDRSVGTPMKKAEVSPTTTTSDDSEMTAESSPKKELKKLRAKHLHEKMHLLGKLILEAKKAKKKEAKVEEDPNEGNAFGKAVSDAKKDGIQKGEKVKVGGKEYPVKESAKAKCNHTPKGKKCPVHGLKECGSMYEGNDGNLANNAKPYDKVTRGDVIAGRLGKDEMGGKSKKKSKAVEENYTINGKKVSKAAYEKEMSKAGKGKKKVKESWTHDTLAAELFESGDEYMVALRNKLDKQLKG